MTRCSIAALTIVRPLFNRTGQTTSRSRVRASAWSTISITGAKIAAPQWLGPKESTLISPWKAWDIVRSLTLSICSLTTTTTNHSHILVSHRQVSIMLDLDISQLMIQKSLSLQIIQSLVSSTLFLRKLSMKFQNLQWSHQFKRKVQRVLKRVWKSDHPKSLQTTITPLPVSRPPSCPEESKTLTCSQPKPRARTAVCSQTRL